MLSNVILDSQSQVYPICVVVFGKEFLVLLG